MAAAYAEELARVTMPDPSGAAVWGVARALAAATGRHTRAVAPIYAELRRPGPSQSPLLRAVGADLQRLAGQLKTTRSDLETP